MFPPFKREDVVLPQETQLKGNCPWQLEAGLQAGGGRGWREQIEGHVWLAAAAQCAHCSLTGRAGSLQLSDMIEFWTLIQNLPIFKY